EPRERSGATGAPRARVGESEGRSRVGKRRSEASEPRERSGATGAPRARVLGSARGAGGLGGEGAKRVSHASGAGRQGPRERASWGVRGAQAGWEAKERSE